MIGVKLIGRLGNQLFQYAFAYSVSKKLKTPFLLIESEYHHKYNIHYFRLRLFEKLSSKIATSFYFKLSKKFKIIKEYDNNEVLTIEELINFKNNLVYEGFFQSENYFREYEKHLRQLFTIKRKYKNFFNNKYSDLILREVPLLVIHYRGTDYKNWGGTDYTLPIDYYLNAMSLIEDLNQYRLVILTDDINLAKKTFKTLWNAEYISDSEINDFQILLNADKLIISNSTFAWWGAYLNYHNAEVFAPKYWLGFKNKSEQPLGIMSVNWNWIDF